MVEQYYGFSPAFCISHKCLSLGKSTWVPCWQKFYKCNSQASMPFDVWESMGNGIEPNWQQIIQHNICCRKGDPFQGLRVDSCLTVWNELFKEAHMLTKQETFLERGAQVRTGGSGNPGELLGHVAPSLRSYVMGFVSELSLASHSDSGSFWVAHAWLSQDAFQWGGFWEVGRTDGLKFPFDFSKFFQLMVAC